LRSSSGGKIHSSHHEKPVENFLTGFFSPAIWTARHQSAFDLANCTYQNNITRRWSTRVGQEHCSDLPAQYLARKISKAVDLTNVLIFLLNIWRAKYQKPLI